jgi:hypothetical protein
MITITYHPADAPLAKRLLDDLRANGFTVAEGVQSGREHTLILLVSPRSNEEADVQRALNRALDNGQRVLPVLVHRAELPTLIGHLEEVDLTGGYNFDTLKRRLDALSSGGSPMTVRSPRVRASNRRIGYILVALALVLFVFGMWAIVTFKIQAPVAEFARADTEVAETRDALIAPTMAYLATYLPRSTEQAAEFSSTLQGIPTLVQPFVAQTATQIYYELATVFATPNAPPSNTPDAG